MMQTASLQSKGQKQVGLGSGVEMLETRRNALETAPVGLQEGAGGLSFTVHLQRHVISKLGHRMEAEISEMVYENLIRKEVQVPYERSCEYWVHVGLCTVKFLGWVLLAGLV